MFADVQKIAAAKPKSKNVVARRPQPVRNPDVRTANAAGLAVMTVYRIVMVANENTLPACRSWELANSVPDSDSVSETMLRPEL